MNGALEEGRCLLVIVTVLGPGDLFLKYIACKVFFLQHAKKKTANRKNFVRAI